ncbi:hypothetical protein A3C09_02050 [Candidatus Uhrbacteria bacterium RIFCSPHIGHO2_02_FULL_47_44]|uniref:Serine aminopeptidase S33 domain-containing protein n=1 Tax=Candidatus Uhrbacteria bacterium RIFCSPLOWO2_02_FULL_48_18 TaxID=1802408 RepID=A0A1F7VBN4_9BACT|nr:MAG: hypothetical protein A2839_00620 [Candidatus Uhrbacteria bacterium RIFCSPHIGHO2_01_FULL_47_10]OGL70462.1 MAG: hypothetical protein A3C09_02050 [Candidatus Uhrbacteria bacterium RIFCSPHIGHO2_02_FULL_47_44]OGL76846.1 MAG: hypothetical protein A3E97_01725 [Candidatus Uhrbacteria bacterium RIFCSPHIGHO2_12_FULL_47_12]OGL82315.1 MAG: hypothetical protein A3B20_01005 [Candidatus Uhrbacteria bacterium RIFCSPLOWO2_01_FULL_47_17]OGL87962.1 MAG: hypothetical protein A3I41_02535 [Candidatus Uhrbact
MNTERVILKTVDNIEIVGIYRTPPDATHAAILLHMMPATKESWDAFSTALEEVGYASLAIDLRGHGESVMLGALDYKKFDDPQHQATWNDVEVAFSYLKEHGFKESDIVMLGASIGANLAIQALMNHPATPLAIALSPGVDYHGVKTDMAIANMHEQQRVVLMASDDDQESYIDVKKLHELNKEQTTVIEKHGAGHGTRMFENDSALIKEIISLLPEK